MLIASKYEEIWAPEVRDFVYISDRAYSRDQILNMEKIMLNVSSTAVLGLVRQRRRLQGQQGLSSVCFVARRVFCWLQCGRCLLPPADAQPSLPPSTLPSSTNIENDPPIPFAPLQVLRFNLTVPTPYQFLNRFMKAAGAQDDQ